MQYFLDADTEFLSKLKIETSKSKILESYLKKELLICLGSKDRISGKLIKWQVKNF